LAISGHGDPRNVVLDYVFSNLPPAAVKQVQNLGGGGSDHNAISVLLQVGQGAPLQDHPPPPPHPHPPHPHPIAPPTSAHPHPHPTAPPPPPFPDSEPSMAAQLRAEQTDEQLRVAKAPQTPMATTSRLVVLTTSTSPDDAAGTSDEMQGCATICTRRGESRMCVERIHWLARTMLHTTPFETSCPEARQQVIDECPNCDVCSLYDAGCPLPPAQIEVGTTKVETTDVETIIVETTSRPALLPEHSVIDDGGSDVIGSDESGLDDDGTKGCATICTRRGEPRMCVERVHWIVQDVLFDTPFKDACPAARKQVIEECPICKVCSLYDAGCPVD